MKSIRSILGTAIPGVAMIILILDAKTALSGAAKGIELCIRTVIPSLFPFLFLSILITGSMMNHKWTLLRPIGRFCRIPEGSEGLLLMGLIGGYPVGAQAVAQAYQNGQLSRNEASRMLGFCSNAGPSFIFGMLSGVFSEPGTVWFLWGIHILSALITGMLLPGGGGQLLSVKTGTAISPTAALERSVGVMAGICGWVIIFRVIIVFCQRWFLWLLPQEFGTALSGLLELTNGCCQLSLVDSEGLRFLIAALLLGFGGSCVGLQTQFVTQHLGTGLYFPGKGIQAAVSVLLACLAQPLLFGAEMPSVLTTVSALAVLLPVIALNRRKNNSSNLARQGV